MRTLFQDMSQRQVFGWHLWRAVEAEWKRLRPSINNEMERWHLRELHSLRRVQYLARWLCGHAEKGDPDAMVKVSSAWIDQYPKAHAGYIDASGSKQSVSVELADTLVLVKVMHPNGSIRRERALLLQAKCADDPEVLDGSNPGDSTGKERNLLELCFGSISVTTGTSAGSAAINPARAAGYQLPGVTQANPGLRPFARYLLIPRTEVPAKKPYMLLWPKDRLSEVSQTGKLCHWSDAILGMAGLPTPRSACVGQNVTHGKAANDWSHLIDDLVRFCGSRPAVSRFENAGAPIPRLIETDQYRQARVQSGVSFLGHLYLKLMRWTGSDRLLSATLIADGKSWPPSGDDPPGRDDDDDAPGGFTILTVSITTAGDISAQQE